LETADFDCRMVDGVSAAVASRRTVERPRSAIAARALVPWLGLVVSGAFAYLAVGHVHVAEVWRGLASSTYWWLAPACAAIAASVFLKAVRWRYLFAPETRPGLRAATASMLVGYFFNMVLPARAGEAVRVVYLRRRAGASPVETAATVAVERLYDVLGLLVMLLVASPWLPPISWLRAAEMVAVGLALAVAAAAALFAVFGSRPLLSLARPLRALPFLEPERLELAVGNLFRGLAAVRRPRLIAAALLWTFLSWAALGVCVELALRGFHLRLPLGAALLVLVASNLSQVLPSSPSALGVFEASGLLALGAYGVAGAQALPCVLVLHAVNVLPFVAAGVLLLRPRRGRPSPYLARS
jgi:phosphatidylinositol alpha-mannosyltransferase